MQAAKEELLCSLTQFNPCMLYYPLDRPDELTGTTVAIRY